MNILSLGAGVQSSTLLLMALAGELKEEFGKLDAVIFSDTGWEPKRVYLWLAFLVAQCNTEHVPFYRVTRGHIRSDALDPHRRFASMPFYVRTEQGKVSTVWEDPEEFELVTPTTTHAKRRIREDGKIKRQCTSDYKIMPIEAKVRELCGLNPRQRSQGGVMVTQWIGISLDEAQRMNPSRTKFIAHRWPLIEMQMTRHDCKEWLTNHGYPIPPKSSCIGCPFHKNDFWRDLRDTSPEEWEDACQFDEAIRSGNVRFGKAALRGQAYLHRSLIPLRLVDLSTPEDHGQRIVAFGEECTGMCGV